MPSVNNILKSAKSKNTVNCGFTLIELLVVSMIVVVIALAINYSLASGVKVWKKINQESAEEYVNIFFDKFTTDLHNSLNYADIKFIGQEDRLSFATLLVSPRFSGRAPGEVAYAYNTNADTLDRKLKDNSAIYNDEEGRITPVLKNVVSLDFFYYYFDAQGKDYRWRGEWEKNDLPLAVRVEFEIKDGEKFKKFTRTVTIPISG